MASCRGGGPGTGAISVATRLPVTLERQGGWASTILGLPPGRWLDHLSGDTWEGESPVGDLLAGLPVALLTPVPLEVA